MNDEERRQHWAILAITAKYLRYVEAHKSDEGFSTEGTGTVQQIRESSLNARLILRTRTAWTSLRKHVGTSKAPVQRRIRTLTNPSIESTSSGKLARSKLRLMSDVPACPCWPIRGHFGVFGQCPLTTAKARPLQKT